MTTYHGVLTFHSETGTEGGAWAFQDEQFMGLDAGSQYRCTRCGRVWNRDQTDVEPKPMFQYWRDDWTENGQNYSGGYYTEDEFDPNGNLGPGESYPRAANESARQCAEEGHADWANMYPDGMWSYDGLHILKDGDWLSVEDGVEVLFSGEVLLPPRQDPYAEGAYAAGGFMAAHSEPPAGTDEKWWFDEKRATLTTKEDEEPALKRPPMNRSTQ